MDPDAARQLAQIQQALASQRPITAATPIIQQVDCWVITVAYSDVSGNRWPERKYKAGVLHTKTARSEERAHSLIRARFDIQHAYLLAHDEMAIAARYVENVKAGRLTPKQAEDALYLKAVERNGKDKARRHAYAAIAADVERHQKEQEADAELDAETIASIQTFIAIGEDDALILAALPQITPTQLQRVRQEPETTALAEHGLTVATAKAPRKPRAPKPSSTQEPTP
jgi:hypothetical protein